MSPNARQSGTNTNRLIKKFFNNSYLIFMVSFYEASLTRLSIHRVGNKAMDEFYVLSDQPVEVTGDQAGQLMHYFLNPFQKVNEVYNFYHPSNDVSLNVVNHLVAPIFHGEDFHSMSRKLAVHLYDHCNHPKIKSGELYVAYLHNVQIDAELHDAIGVFKSENKETYLTVHPNQQGFDLSFETDAINIQHLDKGCLIINTDAENGFKVVCIDQKGKDAVYWKDEFLSLKIKQDKYTHTSHVLSMCKHFITDQLPEEFEIAETDKIDLLNKSLKYFKEKESYDVEEFAHEVFSNPAAISSFKSFKSIYDEDFDSNVPEAFEISDAAVKKQASSYKKILKLDKNFHIYVHGDKNLIERGFDEEKMLKYYKVYFQEETI
jgi:hypothetical protein